MRCIIWYKGEEIIVSLYSHICFRCRRIKLAWAQVEQLEWLTRCTTRFTNSWSVSTDHDMIVLIFSSIEFYFSTPFLIIGIGTSCIDYACRVPFIFLTPYGPHHDSTRKVITCIQCMPIITNRHDDTAAFVIYCVTTEFKYTSPFI